MPESTPTVGRWESARVKMAFPEGMQDAVEAYTHPDAPGLAVTRDHAGYGWSVTHIASGRAVERTRSLTRIATREDAERFVLALAPLTDWTRSMDAIIADKATLTPKANVIREAVFGASIATRDAEDESDDE